MRNIQEIVEILKTNNITGYKLAKDLTISPVGAQKILSGQSENPRPTTIKMLDEYIDNNFTSPSTSSNATSDNLSSKYHSKNKISENFIKELESITKENMPDEVIQIAIRIIGNNWNRANEISSFFDEKFNNKVAKKILFFRDNPDEYDKWLKER